MFLISFLPDQQITFCFRQVSRFPPDFHPKKNYYLEIRTHKNALKTSKFGLREPGVPQAVHLPILRRCAPGILGERVLKA